jgi:hypothetical protein
MRARMRELELAKHLPGVAEGSSPNQVADQGRYVHEAMKKVVVRCGLDIGCT